jgi:predicted amidophosphoribosyltransferase
MEKLLEQAFEKASSLPKKERKAFAAFILEELQQEKKWDKLYKKSPEILRSLANEASREYEEGRTEKLDPDKL